MKQDFLEQMGSATSLTRQGRLSEATRMIQAALAGEGPGTAPPSSCSAQQQVTALSHVDAANSPMRDAAADATAPCEGHEVEGAFTALSLTRRFLLAIPAASKQPRSLIVMLHGCSQSAEDFARGTRMSAHGRARGYYVLYPSQSHDANPSSCWNWFRTQDQQRASGEAAFLAELTTHIVKEHGIDPRRVFIAGLSAGGAMAAVVADAFPEIFTAVGVHSGLAAGAASNLPDALAAMRSGQARRRRAGRRGRGPGKPTIVFHGEEDHTVHPGNGDAIIDQAIGEHVVTEVTESGKSSDGKRYSRTVYAGDRLPVAEQWTLGGVGHAWSGGDPLGSYTDATGVDASNEMVRFFSEQADAA